MDVFTTRRNIDQLKMINVLCMSLRSSYPVLSVINVCKVHLSNVMFQNNSSPLIHSSPLFKMIGINIIIYTTVIEGYFSFMFNSGKSGILIRTINFSPSPSSRFEINFNNVKGSLLCLDFIKNKTSRSVWLNTMMCIQNNTIKSGAIMEVTNANSIAIKRS